MDCFSISSGTLTVRILQRGAALAAVRFQPDGRNLVLGFADPQDHLNVPIYAGVLVGPVANRIAGGKIAIDGIPHQMEINEPPSAALHSGREGLHARLWTVAQHQADKLHLTTTLPDGACGLPGTREISAQYSVAGTTLRLEITALTDRATPMNIAAHPYWNLDGRADVMKHTLQCPAKEFTETSADNLPTGRCLPTEDTAFDFHKPRQVPRAPALDINFCLSHDPRETPAHAARLTGADGTVLNIATTAPGLQIYNGSGLPTLSGCLDDGGNLAPFGGIALEPQFWPDAPNQPGFPQITLQPGTVWRQVTTYQLCPPNSGTNHH